MEVTVNNFEELLPQIEESIDRAVFLAIDTELSGLKVSDEKENCFETMEERYYSVRSSASSFLVLQFGLVPFFYSASRDEWTYEAYNFYTFPRQTGKNSPNVRFLSESSSLDFLAASSFDFNKLIYGGIPYLTYGNEERMREEVEKNTHLFTGTQADEAATPLSVPESMKKFVHDTIQKIHKFSKSSESELRLENLSAFQRKLIFNNIKPNFSRSLFFETIVVAPDPETTEEMMDATDVILETDAQVSLINLSSEGSKSYPSNRWDGKNRVLRILKLGQEEQAALLHEKKQAEFEAIHKNVGFSKVIRKISQAGKYVVGHNMLLDISHTIHQFIDELPESLPEFKERTQAIFSNLVDTKLMSATHPFRELIPSSVLFDLMKRVSEPPFTLPKISKVDGERSLGYNLDDRKRHEAGYDAFITGSCFIAMTQHLGTLQNPPKNRVLPDSPLIMPFLNKLYIMRMSDISYLNISGTDLTPSRSHVFYVTCPKEATMKTIQQIFAPFGNIQIWWKNSTSLFVALFDKDQSSFVMDNIECSSEYRVMTFASYQKLVQNDKKSNPVSSSNLVESPERAGDIFKKLVSSTTTTSGPDSPKSSPPPRDHKKTKRLKTEAERVKMKEVFEVPTSWS